MLVERFTFFAKEARGLELREMLLGMAETWGPHLVRAYKPHTGRRERVVMEMEFESWEEREKFWDEWTNPADPETIAEYLELVDRSRSSELWQRVL